MRGETGEEREVRWTLCRKLDSSGATRLSGKESTCQAGDTGWIPGWEGHLEKETATHFSILVWRIPWTEEPGGLQSMGSQ